MSPTLSHSAPVPAVCAPAANAPATHAPALTEATPIYYGILTDQGQALLASAIASGLPLPLTQMAVGDGAGQPVTPLPEMTELTNEVYRAPLNQLFVDPTAPNQIVAEMVMGETVGGFWIRELGLYDESGTLFAVANAPASYKPILDEGAGRALLTRMVLIVSDTSAVELILNPDTVMASKAYVDAKIAEHAASRDHPAAIEGAQGMIPLATQAMVDEGTDHTSAVTPKTAGNTFARQQHEHEIDDVLWLQEALDEKADVGHQHEAGDVEGLPEALNEKLNRGGDTATGNLIAPKFIMNAIQGVEAGAAVRLDYLNTQIPKAYGACPLNLNDAVAPGFYAQSTFPTTPDHENFPVPQRGGLIVFNAGGGIGQLYLTNDGPSSQRLYYRAKYYDTWGTWASLYDTDHKPTAADIGAAPASHAHTPAEVGAAPAAHGHAITDVNGLQDALDGKSPTGHAHTPADVGAAPASHTHSAADVGAAPASHTHTPAETGAAPAVHTHFSVKDALSVAFGVTYYNTGTSTMYISVTSWHGGDDDDVACYVNGDLVSFVAVAMSDADSDGTYFHQGFMVPAGGSWQISQWDGTETALEAVWGWK